MADISNINKYLLNNYPFLLKNDNIFSENNGKKIDLKVYELYGLSKEDIKFIENDANA